VSELERLLCEGAELMDISLSDYQVDQLLAYHKLIEKWNQVYNLSAIRDPIESIKKHFLDSLSIVNFIQPGLLLDVGSGAGLPGIVIAIMKPKTKVFTIDSVGKKCRFMQTVKTELSLENLTVVNNRVENFNYEEPFQQIVSRAFSSGVDTIEKTRIHSLKVPFVSDKRSLLEINI